MMPDEDLNRAPPENKSEVLPFKPTYLRTGGGKTSYAQPLEF